MADIESQLKSVGASGALNAAAALQVDASSYANTSDVEHLWALKTHNYAEVYMKLITAVDPKNVKLTKFDDIIDRLFKRFFRTLPVDVLDVEEFKSEKSKAIWRKFCKQFKGKIENFNFGTLIRIDCNKDYTEENTLLVTRIQFYAIELARNRRGFNNFHKKNTNEVDKSIIDKVDNLNTNDDKSDR